MNEYMMVLRFLHVGLGVFWAGTIFFVVAFLAPSVRDAGPDGARVMQALQRRHFLNVMPIVAGFTILTGVMLYERLSGGFATDWILSRFGLSLTIGGVASILAFLVGVFVMRAATLRAGRLNEKTQSTPENAEREALQAEIMTLRKRAASGAHWVAVLLAIAVATMAVARYL